MNRWTRSVCTAGAVVVISGCASTGVNEVNHASKSPSPSANASPSSSAAHVGATLTIHGEASGEVYQVTVTQVIDPSTGSDEFDQPSAGDKFVSIVMTIKNTGSKAESDDADNDSKLIDSAGVGYETTLFSVGNCQDISSFNLGPGESQSGCETFEVPTAAVPAKFQYDPDSTFATDFGEWLIP